MLVVAEIEYFQAGYSKNINCKGVVSGWNVDKYTILVVLELGVVLIN